jgi:hypothetical protein
MNGTGRIPAPGRSRFLAAALGLLVVAGSGCTAWRTQNVTPQALLAAKSPGKLRVTVFRPGALGETQEIAAPRIEGDSLVGMAIPEVLDDGYHGSIRERIAIHLEDVSKIEVRELSAPRTAAAIAVGVGVTALVVVANAMSDLDPLGSEPSSSQTFSCPIIESWDGSGWRIDSGTFGGAIAPALHRTDVDNLDWVTVSGGKVRLRISDIADETDHVDAVRLVKARSAPGFTVSPDSHGELFSLGPIIPPMTARDISGKDVGMAVGSLDGRVWESNPADWDTSASGRIRDGVEISFLRPAGATRAKLVVDASNTPWSAALMVDMVEAHGRMTSDWYRSLDDSVTRAGAERLLEESFLAVAVRTKQGWQTQGTIREAGPEVLKRQVHRLDLSAVEGDTVRVRLESIPSFWLIDQVGIDYTEEVGFEAVDLPLVKATDRQGQDVRPLITAGDGLEYVMEKGDGAELEFADDPRVAGSCSYLLYTTGWYRIHVRESGEPQVAMLRRMGREPESVSRMAVAKLHAAAGRVETRSR